MTKKERVVENLQKMGYTLLEKNNTFTVFENPFKPYDRVEVFIHSRGIMMMCYAFKITYKDRRHFLGWITKNRRLQIESESIQNIINYSNHILRKEVEK